MLARPRLPERNLDLLRAVAVLCVVLDHAMTTRTGNAGVWGPVGHAGVLLFFCHTAAVLMASLDRIGQSGQSTGWGRAVTFWRRRAWRIYPLAIAAVLVVVLLRLPARPWEVSPVPVTVTTVVSNLALTQNLTRSPVVLVVLWSLPLELQMYVLLPAVAAWLKRWPGLLGVLALCLVGAIAGAIQQHTWMLPGVNRLGVLSFAPCFLSGVALYALGDRWRRDRARHWHWLWLPALILVIAGYGVVAVQHERYWLDWGVSGGAALALLVLPDAPPAWYTRIARQIAEYSYGIYLWHCLALVAVVRLTMTVGAPLAWLAGVVILAALTIAGYHWIERPGIERGKRVGHRQRAATDAAAVTAP